MSFTLRSLAIKSLLTIVLSLFSLSLLLAQKKEVSSMKAIHLGESQPLSELLKQDYTLISPFKRNMIKEDKASPAPNFYGKKMEREKTLKAKDKDGAINSFSTSDLKIGTKRNDSFPLNYHVFEGQGSPFVPDVNGDIGDGRFVQAVNASTLEVYDKFGNVVVESFPSTLIWAGTAEQTLGDPIILYDRYAERWLLLEISSNFSSMLVAYSTTSDPLSSYNRYTIPAGEEFLPDYPKVGIWQDEIIITTNENFDDIGHSTYFLNKDDLVDGATELRSLYLRTTINVDPIFVFTSTPVTAKGPIESVNSEPLALWYGDDDWVNQDEDELELYTYNVNWDEETVDFTTETFPLDDFSTLGLYNQGQNQSFPQPSGTYIDGIVGVTMYGVSYRNIGEYETIALSFTVNVDGNGQGGVRWVELRRYPGEEWQKYQEGTLSSDDDLNRFMPTIGIDKRGNIALGYAVSSFEVYPSLRMTGRLGVDPKGLMTFGETTIGEGSASLTSSPRYGDYFSVSVDPRDDRTFWLTGEYVKFPDSASSKIAKFNLYKLSQDLTAQSIVSPTSGSNLTENEEVRVLYKNIGTEVMRDFRVGYQFNSETIVNEEASIDSLLPDSTYSHSFADSLDLSQKGNYDLKVFLESSTDQDRQNDTLPTIIEHKARNDLALNSMQVLSNKICGSEAKVNIEFRNKGIDTINYFEIEYSYNAFSDTLQWQGELVPDEFSESTYSLQIVDNEIDEINFNIINPNMSIDELREDNRDTLAVEVLESGIYAVLTMTTDQYPSETSCKIVNEEGDEIYTSEPYEDRFSTIRDTICIDSTGCYTFLIFDSYGDGFSEASNGGYELTTMSGRFLAGLSKQNFGNVDSNYFCVDTSICNLTMQVSSQDPTSEISQNGMILVDASGGNGKLEYSINDQPFQSISTFNDLDTGTYIVRTRDEVCEIVDTVNLSYIVSNENSATAIQDLQISPNPFTEYFRVELRIPSINSHYINYRLFNGSGNEVQSGSFLRYDETFKGIISIASKPAGSYYLKLEYKDFEEIRKVIKVR